MPRVDFQLWDRIYILKLICTAQATYSSFVVLIYFYLIILQSWTASEDDRPDIMKFKWSVIAVGALDFGLGILLAFAANMTGIRCRRRILIWIILETFLIPISIFLLMQLHKRLLNSNQYLTDTHYSRVNIAQVCFLVIQYIFIAYAIDFLVQGQRKVKTYDPSIRPKSVYAPTDPQITTTESRHIRMSQSLLFQPSSSKALSRNFDKEVTVITNECTAKELSEYVGENWRIEEMVQVQRREVEALRRNEDVMSEKAGMVKNERMICARCKDCAEDKKDGDWMKEEKTELQQTEDKECAADQEKEWTEDEKEWRRDESYWMVNNTEQTNKERDNKEYEDKERIDWTDLEGRKDEDTKEGDNQKT